MDAKRREGGPVDGGRGPGDRPAGTYPPPRTGQHAPPLFQTFIRALPGARDAGLFGSLEALYLLWARLMPSALGMACRVARVELLLGGARTASDHHYLHVNGCTLGHCIEAAAEKDLRVHAGRGAISLGPSAGSLSPMQWWRPRRTSCATPGA